MLRRLLLFCRRADLVVTDATVNRQIILPTLVRGARKVAGAGSFCAVAPLRRVRIEIAGHDKNQTRLGLVLMLGQ